VNLMEIAPKVKLTLPILDEVNQFSRLNLNPERLNQVPCFSDALLNVHMCNPDVPPEGSEPVCSIHWICKCFLGARMGVGLAPDEPYNFEKSKAFCKQLTYAKLMEAIKAKQGLLVEKDAPTLVEESISEEKLKEAELAKPLTESVEVKAPKNATVVVAKEPKEQVSKEAIGSYKPGSQGHYILSNLQVSVETPKNDIWVKVAAKGWSSEKTFEKTLAKLIEEKLLEMPTADTLVRKA